MDEETDAEATTPGAARTSRSRVAGWVAAALAFPLVYGGLTLATSLGDDETPGPSSASTAVPEAQEREDAMEFCQSQVETRLRAPATAQWSDLSSVGAEGYYTAAGAVDSENGFGALLRSRFVCEVTHTAAGWTLERISLG